MNYIEEKTPGGITIKVLLKSWEYTAFKKNGSVIYANEAAGDVLHKILVIAFFGKHLDPEIPPDSEIMFYKISKGELVIPYQDLVHNKRKYFFLKNDALLDMIPVRALKIVSIYKLVREVDTGTVFNHIIIDKSLSINEIAVIKNRCPSAELIQTGLAEGVAEKPETRADSSQMDYDLEKNLNIMSNNPVFLARIHLKDMALSKVNQLLLDFDISSLEAEYMLRFIETMMENKEDENIRKAMPKLSAQADAFRFYISLLNKKDDETKCIIEEADDINKISLYSTLVAKVKILFTKQEDILMLTEYENLLFEAKDRLQKK